MLNITKDESELQFLQEKLLEEMQNQGSTYITKIIAKLENEEAIKNLEGILEKSDVIMVARGMLGTILPIEKISWIQKGIIKVCNQVAKPVIISSQFLESMIHTP